MVENRVASKVEMMVDYLVLRMVEMMAEMRVL